MHNIIIYTKPTCPYCIKAKALLNSKGASYEEIEIVDNEKNVNEELRQEMINKSGGCTTVPQIFINNEHIGGCDSLHELEEEGKLDELLK